MCWNVELFSKILPRHMELIMLIDYFFLEKLKLLDEFKDDSRKQQRLSILSERDDGQQIIKISHFCFLSSKLFIAHSLQIMDASKSVIYRELDDLFP
jgi:starch phosphorylase